MSRKIDTYNFDDLEECSTFLYFLCKLRIRSAEDMLSSVNWDLSHSFCDNCNAHEEQECGCDRSDDRDIFNDGDDFE